MIHSELGCCARRVRLGKVRGGGTRLAQKYSDRVSVGWPRKMSARHESEASAKRPDIARLVNQIKCQEEIGLTTTFWFLNHRRARQRLAFLDEGARSLPQ